MAAATASSPSPLPWVLVRLGVISPADAAAATVADLSCSHVVRRVSTPSGDFVVKIETTNRPGLDRERLVHRLAVHVPPLRAVLPPSHVLDGQAPVVVECLPAPVHVSGPLPSGGSPPTTRSGERRTPTGSDSLLGSMLAGVHRSTMGLPLPLATEPSLLMSVRQGGGDADTGAQRRWTASLPPDARAVVAAVVRDRLLREAAAEVGDASATCLVHHDVKQPNTWFGPDPVTSDLHGYLLDWELAGLGNPAVDLGWALAETLFPPHSPGVRDQERDSSSAPSALSPGAIALLAGYRDGADLHPDTIVPLARRTVLASGLRVAQQALEMASHFGPPTRGQVTRLLGRARSLIADVDPLTEKVTACLT